MSMGKNRASSKHSGQGRARSGGGLTSNKLKNVRQGTREAPKVRAANVKAVAEQGAMRGNHATDTGDFPFKREPLYQGASFQPVALGNTLTTNVGKGGPGAGRTLYGQSGTVKQYGEAAGAPKPAGRDVWADFPGNRGK